MLVYRIRPRRRKKKSQSGACGVLAPGCVADFALWRIDRPADLAYAMGLNPCAGVVKDGAPAR